MESAPVLAVPLVAFPVEKPPAEVQDVAFDADQERVDDCPVLTVDGEAEKVIVGAGVATQELEFAGSNHEPLLQV